MDDVLAVLEETQVLVQTILGSRFVGPMQKRVDEWEKKLRLFSETLDEWLSVQRAWMCSTPSPLLTLAPSHPACPPAAPALPIPVSIIVYPTPTCAGPPTCDLPLA